MEKLMMGLSVAIAFMTMPSFGLNAVEMKMLSNAKLSPYEVLRDLYSTSTQPAQLSDIDYFTTKVHPNTQKCVLAGETYRNPVNVILARIVYEEMSEPYQGPLFPGHAARRNESVGLFGYISNEVPSMSGLADATAILADASDLVITYRGGAANYERAKPYELKVRKNQDFLAFSYFVPSAEDPLQKQIYGYCYRETARH